MDIKRCGHTLNVPFSAMTSHGHHARSYPHAPPQTTSILQFTVQPVCPTASPLHPLIAPFHMVVLSPEAPFQGLFNFLGFPTLCLCIQV